MSRFLSVSNLRMGCSFLHLLPQNWAFGFVPAVIFISMPCRLRFRGLLESHVQNDV